MRPFAGLRAIHVEHEAISEEGPFALDIAERDIDSFRGRAGARVQYAFPSTLLIFDVLRTLEFNDEATDGEATASLPAFGSPAVTVSGVDVGDSRFVLSPALVIDRGPVHLFGRYRLAANDESTFQSGEGGVEVVW